MSENKSLGFWLDEKAKKKKKKEEERPMDMRYSSR